MDITPPEAQEALGAINAMALKTKRAISSSGASTILVIWGVIWIIGFLANHFIRDKSVCYLWIILDVAGVAASFWVAVRARRRIHTPLATGFKWRLPGFWALLFLHFFAVVSVVGPLDGAQLAATITIFVMVGWSAMSLLLTFLPFWLAPGITALTLIGYFFLPHQFHLWMAVLGGGGLMALSRYIKHRW